MTTTAKEAGNGGNSCYNSHGEFSPANRILSVIDASQVELTPLEISEKTGLNRSSVRQYLRNLLQQGKVVQPYPGAYCNRVTHGMRFNPLTVHNISLRVTVNEDLLSWVGEEKVGDVKVHVCFGSERRKISGYIANDAGMSKDACLLAIQRWMDMAEKRLGRPLPEPLELLCFEVNKDYSGLRLDGVQCVTKKDLMGIIERTYQKEEGVIRHEHKVNQSMSLQQFESLIQGGVVGYSMTQLNYQLLQRVDRLTEALKFTNSHIIELEKQNNVIMRRMLAMDEEKKTAN